MFRILETACFRNTNNKGNDFWNRVPVFAEDLATDYKLKAAHNTSKYAPYLR